MSAFFCINLERRGDRKAAFTESFKRAGLDESRLEFIKAVDGRMLGEESLVGFHHNPRQTLPNKLGRLGCYKSHCIAIRAALLRNEWPAVIFEDDVAISPHIKAAITSTPSADLAYLGALPVIDRTRVALLGEGWITPPRFVKLYGGHAYMLPSREAASRLLEFVKRHPMTFDSALVRYQKQPSTEIRVHLPFAAVQAAGVSDIDTSFKRHNTS
jgi:hypothetical protein